MGGLDSIFNPTRLPRGAISIARLAASEAEACLECAEGFHVHSHWGDLNTRHAMAGSGCSRARSLCELGLQVTQEQVCSRGVRKARVP